MLVQREHFFKDIISTATQRCYIKIMFAMDRTISSEREPFKYKNYASFSF